MNSAFSFLFDPIHTYTHTHTLWQNGLLSFLVFALFAEKTFLIVMHQKLNYVKRTDSTGTQYFPIEMQCTDSQSRGKENRKKNMMRIHLKAIKNGSRTMCRTIPMYCGHNNCCRFVYGFLIAYVCFNQPGNFVAYRIMIGNWWTG